MGRSFDLVDRKLAEADFFLEKLDETGADFFAAGCYFNAFVSAARSVTYSLQAVLSDHSSFKEWYSSQQAELRKDSIAKFFLDVRRINQHVGETPFRGGSGGPGRKWLFHFSACQDYPSVPTLDVVSSCRHYMTLLSEIVCRCYETLGAIIDPEQYYTKEAFARRGLTIEDAEEELFGIRGWTDVPGVPVGYQVVPEEYRWQMIRDTMPGCQIDHLFDKYLGRIRPRPARIDRPSPESLTLPDGWTRDGQWLLPPGYNDIDAYLEARRTGKAPIN